MYFIFVPHTNGVPYSCLKPSRFRCFVNLQCVSEETDFRDFCVVLYTIETVHFMMWVVYLFEKDLSSAPPVSEVSSVRSCPLLRSSLSPRWR